MQISLDGVVLAKTPCTAKIVASVIEIAVPTWLSGRRY
jgi:hypothetical protein